MHLAAASIMESGMRQILGQSHALAFLQQAWIKSPRPGCYLLSGPRGVGKFTTALQLSQQSLCRDHSACGACPSCKKIAHQNHVDLVTLTPSKGAISLEMVRGLMQTLQYPPLESLYRFVLIDDAHTLNAFAANALLKTLEEPPAQNIIALITPAADNLPLTLRSRLQLVRFAPLAASLKAQLLQMSEAQVRLWEYISGPQGPLLSDFQQQWDSLMAFRQTALNCLVKLDTAAPPQPYWQLAAALNEDEMQLKARLLHSLLRDLHFVQQSLPASYLIHADLHDSLKQIKIAPQVVATLLEESAVVLQAVEQYHANQRIATEYLISRMEGA